MHVRFTGSQAPVWEPRSSKLRFARVPNDVGLRETPAAISGGSSPLRVYYSGGEAELREDASLSRNLVTRCQTEKIRNRSMEIR